MDENRLAFPIFRRFCHVSTARVCGPYGQNMLVHALFMSNGLLPPATPVR
ncbi:hypothetical protein BIFADO_00418 [Bifidobacterium adolescentis L2-32]|uniref:Uncharacterized protein n=1 Tax=Bifidobacterium adolescentis L2-32 TaxID=411481 RepID=A7A3M6_BIFAD|nr:hypothetical protein BIFADO_00418 [Bifidobacterium adolescentis L2-32]